MYLTPEVIGRAENAHKPLMGHALAGTGITFPQWVALKLAARGDAVAQGMTGALKLSEAETRATLDQMNSDGLMTGETLTGLGRRRFDDISARLDAMIGRVYANIPADDLQTAARVLATVIAQANAEVASESG